jgi:transposase
MSATPCFVGIDVAKAQRDIALRPTGERWAVAMVLEATGGSPRAVAHGAEAVRPTPRPPPEAQADELRALLARRRHLVAMRTAAQNRRSSAPPRRRTDIQAPLTWLDTRRAARDEDLDTTRRTRPGWREREELLRSVRGIGPVCTRML